MKNAYPERKRHNAKAFAMRAGLSAGLIASLALTPALLFGAGAGQGQEQSGEVDAPQVEQQAAEARQTHGPTTSSDTLWLIANRYHPDRSVSVYQTMVAFMEKNPHAFPNGNVHELLRGVHLHVPTLAEVREVDLASATQNMVEALGGLPSPRLNAQMRTLQAEYEAQIEQLREELQTAQGDVDDFSARNSELNERLRDLERTLEQLRADLADANANEQALLQQYADLERAQAQRELASSAQRTAASSSQRALVEDAWWHRDYIVYALAAITLFFIFFSMILVRRQSRAAKALAASPYEVAAFKKIEAELDDIAAVEEANAKKDAAGSTDDATDGDAGAGATATNDDAADSDAAAASAALAEEKTEAEVEFLTRENDASDADASDSDASAQDGIEETAEGVPVAPVAKPEYRDIDEIIEEAEAEADDDSDADEGQTEEEAVRHQREQLAAQLDLARAYIEMEEYDEAESAILAVLEGEDETLRNEAAELLKRVKKES